MNLTIDFVEGLGNKDFEAHQENPKTESIGFIVTRHIVNRLTNQYWIQCYLSIRRYYIENLIVFIDDNSDYAYVNSGDVKMRNVRVINSEYPKRGELLSFIYFIREKYFETAVIIHDSVFINSFINFDVETFRIFWDFKKINDAHILDQLYEILGVFEEHAALESFYENQEKIGIFGAMIVIKHDVLMRVHQKYNFDLLLDKVVTRDHRSAFERVLAILLYSTFPDEKPKKIFCDIHDYCKWGIKYLNYNSYRHLPVIKIWTGR